jgi:hypothetical protein
MKCPYCDDEMKSGSIDVYDTLSWSPKGEARRGSTKSGIALNGIVLARYHLICSSSKEAFFCPSCRKIIIDVE